MTRKCFAFGDCARALTIAELILPAQPDNLLAREFRTNCRVALEDVYAFRLGPWTAFPSSQWCPSGPAIDALRALRDRVRFE